MTQPGLALSAERWRWTRRLITEHRPAVAAAAARLYPELPRVADTDLLAQPEWLPAQPLDLAEVTLGWEPDAPAPTVAPAGPAVAHAAAGTGPRGELPVVRGRHRRPGPAGPVREPPLLPAAGGPAGRGPGPVAGSGPDQVLRRGQPRPRGRARTGRRMGRHSRCSWAWCSWAWCGWAWCGWARCAQPGRAAVACRSRRPVRAGSPGRHHRRGRADPAPGSGGRRIVHPALA